jgi:hypothetical protein
MSRGDPDRSPDRTTPDRSTTDDSRGPATGRFAKRPEAPKLVLSLADGPEALNRAFLRMRRVSSRGRG